MTGKHEGSPDKVARAQGLKDSEGLTIPKASFRDFFHFYGQWKNGKILLGTAGSWFMLDVAFYGLNLNTSTVLTAIGYGTGPTVYKVSKPSESPPSYRIATRGSECRDYLRPNLFGAEDCLRTPQDPPILSIIAIKHALTRRFCRFSTTLLPEAVFLSVLEPFRATGRQ